MLNLSSLQSKFEFKRLGGYEKEPLRLNFSALQTKSTTPQQVQETAFSSLKSFAQFPQRALASTFIQPAADVLSIIKNKKVEAQFTPKTKFEKMVFGEEPIKGIFKRVEDAQATTENTLQSIGFDSGTSKGMALAIAPLFVGGITGIDLTPFGGSSNLAKQLARTKDFTRTSSLLRKAKVSEDLIETYAPKFTKIKTEAEALKGLKSLESIAKQTTPLKTQALKPIEPLAQEAKKFNVIPEKEIKRTLDDIKKFKIPINEDGTITLYHGTNFGKEINQSSTLKGFSYLTSNKTIAKDFGKDIIEIRVNPNKIISLGSSNIAGKGGLTFQNPNKLTDIYNQAKGVKEIIKKPIKELEPLAQEAKKYKSAEEFVKDYTASDLLDLSAPEKHRFGRIFDEAEGDRIMDTVDVVKQYAKDLRFTSDANVPMISNKNEIVRIYRMTSKKQKEMLEGDFVSFSKEYAEMHNQTGHLLEKNVLAKDVIWQGNDFNEWIYSPEKIRKQYPKGLTDIYNQAKGAKSLDEIFKPTENLPAVIQGETFSLGTSRAIKATKKEVRSALKADQKILRLAEKDKQIRLDAMDNINRQFGNTDNIIKKLKAKNLVEEDISNIVLEDGTKLIDTVKVKRNLDKSLASVILKSDIKNVAKNYTDKISDKWTKVSKISEGKKVIGNIAKGFELPQVWFERKGLSVFYDDIVKAGRAAESQKTGYIKRFKDADLFKEGIFTKEGGWVTPPRFNISSKEADNIGKYYLTRQGKGYETTLEMLSPKEQEFVRIFDDIIKETEPRFYQVARNIGKEPDKVANYAPLMTTAERKLADTRGAMDWIFRKHPSFFSLKERAKKVPIEVYETDYRKIATRWLAGITDFLNYSEETQRIKYLIESDNFKNIIKGDDFDIIDNWLRSVTTPNLPTSIIGKATTVPSRLLRKGIAMGALGLNYASVLKQALTQIPIGIISKSRPKLQSKFAKAFGIKVSELPSITKRSGDIAIADLQGRVGRIFTGSLTRFDRKNAQVALNGLLDKNYKKFLKEGVEVSPEIQQLILKKSQDAIDLWFGGFFKGQRPEFFRKEVGNFFLMFLYPLNSQLNGFYQHILKAKGITKPKAIAEVLAAATVIAYMEQSIEKLSFQWSDKKEMTKDIMQSLLGNIPLVSQTAYSIMTKQPFAPSPVISSLTNIFKNVNEGMKTGEWERAIFALAEMSGLPKQIRRIKEGMEIINEGGIRDKAGKMLAPVKETDELMRSILRGRYGSKAAKDWIRNIGEKTENRRWFIPQVEFLQNGDYERKAELYKQFNPQEQKELRQYLSEGQLKKLDKALGTEKTLDDIFAPKKKTLDEIFKPKDDKKSIIDTVKNYVKAFRVDTFSAMKTLLTKEQLKDVRNDAVIMERMGIESSQAIKRKGGASKTDKLDHTIPLELGGDNSDKNLKIVTEEEWNKYTPVENYLGKLLNNKTINEKEAQRLIKDFKNGKITFDEIKEIFK